MSFDQQIFFQHSVPYKWVPVGPGEVRQKFLTNRHRYSVEWVRQDLLTFGPDAPEGLEAALNYYWPESTHL